MIASAVLTSLRPEDNNKSYKCKLVLSDIQTVSDNMHAYMNVVLKNINISFLMLAFYESVLKTTIQSTGNDKNVARDTSCKRFLSSMTCSCDSFKARSMCDLSTRKN